MAGGLRLALGARALILWGLPLYLALICLPGLATGATSLFAALALTGACMALLELGLNLQADEIEKSGGRLIMSACHGFWSIGIMTGSLAGAGLAALTLPPWQAVALTSLVSMPIGLALARGLPLGTAAERKAAQEAGSSGWMPGRRLFAISLFTFGITTCEGAVADWSGIFLRDEFALASGATGLGYAAFAAMVAAGRFGGDRLKARLGAVATARLCGALALAGLALVLASPSAGAAIAGFALAGLGVSAAFPLAVTAAAALSDRPAASSVAILTFIALSGFLVGPPAIGFATEYFGIRTGLAMLLPGLAASLLLAGALAARDAPGNALPNTGAPEHA